jgi:beta-lactamase class A
VIANPRTWLHRRLVHNLGGARNHVAMAAIDLRTGRTLTYRPHAHLFTASAAKVGIATAVLRAGRPSASERALLTAMIEHSDNEAADDLWERIGDGEGMSRTFRALGIDDTVPGPGIVWGLTSTTALDQLLLLRKDFVGGALDAWSRRRLLHLMRNVEHDQRWGIRAAARNDDTVAVKNGWLPHRGDDNRWIVSSMGEIIGPKREWLMVVLSDHHPTEGDGIEVVQHVAKLTGIALASITHR